MSDPGVTYALARNFFVWLSERGPFTPGELADAMGIDDELAIRFTKVGTYPCHGGNRQPILEDTGDTCNGTYRGDEPLYRYIPIEDHRWTEHPHETPEWQRWPCGADAPVRGAAIRLVDDRKRRQLMSVGGQRNSVVQRDKRHQKMMDAWAAQREKARLRSIRDRDIGNRKKYRRDHDLPT